MPKWVSAYQGDEGNTVVTVTEDFAKGLGLHTLKSDPATDRHGRPRGPREGNRTSAAKATAASTTTTTTGGKTAKEGSDR